MSVCKKPGCLCPMNEDEECCPDCLTPNPDYKRATVYVRKGYEDRQDYLKSLADEYCMDLQDVLEIAEMLGPTEDFDGLVSSLEDFAEGRF